MKKLYIIGAFTDDEKCLFGFHRYSSPINAEKFFVKKLEKLGFKVIFSAAEVFGEYNDFESFSKYILNNGKWVLSRNLLKDFISREDE